MNRVPLLRPGRYLGTPLGRVLLPDLALVETSYAPHLRLTRHRHERAYYCLVIAGDFAESCGGRDHEGGAWTLIARPAGEEHTQLFGRRGARCLNVEVAPAWLERHHLPASVPSHRRELHARRSGLAARLYREFQVDDDMRHLALEGLAAELVVESVRASRDSDRAAPVWLRASRELLESRIVSPPTLEAFARAVGVHPARLARAFRRHFRCSPAEYVRRRRLEIASRALRETDLPLSQIALEAGFCDQSHLTRAFRRELNTTPAAFRVEGRR